MCDSAPEHGIKKASLTTRSWGHPMTLSERARVGPYEILSLIGAGGMGEVYRARDTRLHRDVAVKVMAPHLAHDASGLRRFELEARNAGALNHPNVLGIFDVGTHDGSPYVVSELLEGETLRTRLRQGLTVQKAIEIAVQIAQGLAAAHEKGIVHRDLKPTNVFITRDGRAKILDFGLAKLVKPDEVNSTDPTRPQTSPGALIGTVGYASPEQVAGKGSDPRSDVFALGVVLYEMLGRLPPFRGETHVDVLSAILHSDPPSLAAHNPHVPPSLEALVRRCLQKRPEERFQSARDLAFALESALVLVQGDEGPRRFTFRLHRAALTRRALGLAAVALGLTLAAVAGFFGRGRVTPSEPPIADPGHLSPQRVTNDPGVESDPALSPDGTLIAYAGGGAQGSDLWLLDVRGGPPIRLTDDPGSDASPVWFPDGSALAFTSERDGRTGIWRVPRLGGPPKRLLDEAFDPAVSPDGERLAFARRGPSGVPQIGVMTFDRPDSAVLISPKPTDPWGHWQPAWSPDAATICFSDLFDLLLLEVETGKVRRLTTDRAGDRYPVFSVDGQRIYFSSSREGTLALWRIGIDGRGLQRMTFGTGPENRPSLAVDKARLAYSTSSVDPDLAFVDRQTGEGVHIALRGTEEAPTFLPDGGGVIFSSNADGQWDLWMQLLDNGRPEEPPQRLTDDRAGESIAAVSPDGRWIAYSRVLDRKRDIWVVPGRGGEGRPLLEAPAGELHPAWSPDGTRIAFVSDREGSPDVWLATVNEGDLVGEPTPLTQGASTDYFPAWSPDGRHVAFVRIEGSRSDAWVVDSNRPSGARRLTTGAVVTCVRWQADSQAVLVSGWWDDESITLRRVPIDGGAPEALSPAVDLGGDELGGYFDVSADGRIVVFADRASRGDVWLLEARLGRF